MTPAKPPKFSFDLLWFLVGREIKVRYRRSVFGLVWALLQPVPLTLILYGVFAGTFRDEIKDYHVYILCGVVFWTFISSGILSAVNSLQRNAEVLHQLPVQASVFPISAVLSAAVHFSLSLVGLLGALILLGLHPSPALLFLPVAIALAILFTAGLGLLLSPLSVFFGDVNEAIGLVLGVAIYATPIFYPVSILPPWLQPIVLNSPLAAILTCFREPIQHGSLPPRGTFAVAVGSALFTFTVGWRVFQRQRRRIPFHV